MERQPTLFAAIAGQPNLLPVFFLRHDVQQSQYDFDCISVKYLYTSALVNWK